MVEVVVQHVLDPKAYGAELVASAALDQVGKLDALFIPGDLM